MECNFLFAEDNGRSGINLWRRALCQAGLFLANPKE